ncbi:MAG: hypothetical protein GF320_00950 [Armatimonadia bacterium]|nr:hypothetical protein [Armatimonadia bacterium]
MVGEFFVRMNLDCWSFFLMGIGALLVLSQVAVFRARYLYVGILGLAMVITAVRRAVDPSEVVRWVLLVAQILAFGLAGVLMVHHSWSNSRRIRLEREERERKLVEELQEIADGARRKKDEGGDGE